MCHPTRRVGLDVPVHQIQIGRRQHCQGDTCISHPLGGVAEDLIRCTGKFRDMPNCHSATISELLRQLTDLDEIQIVGIRSKIEMHVDVDVEVARQLKYAVDLPFRI